MAAKLSLTAKKNIRDNNEAMQTALARLAVFAGGPVVLVEPDWPVFNDVLGKHDDGSYKDRCGEVVAWILSGFAGRLEFKFRGDAEFAAQLQRAWPSKKITVRAGKYKHVDGDKYHGLSLVDGVLTITADEAHMATNVEYTGYEIHTELKLVSAANLSFLLQKNVDEYAPQILSELQQIADATGITGVALSPVDYATMNASSAKFAEDYRDRVAEIVFWFVEGLKTNIVRFVKDDLAKETLHEAWNGSIVLRYDPKFKDPEERFYSGTKFENGGLVITYRGYANFELVGMKIEELL